LEKKNNWGRTGRKGDSIANLHDKNRKGKKIPNSEADKIGQGQEGKATNFTPRGVRQESNRSLERKIKRKKRLKSGVTRTDSLHPVLNSVGAKESCQPSRQSGIEETQKTACREKQRVEKLKAN